MSATLDERRVAAIDIGTNTILLLVADVVEERGAVRLVPVFESATITRLGEGVDRTRRLSYQAVARTLDALSEAARELRRLGVTRVAAVGTSAMRDAGGGPELRRRAAELLGFEPAVIGGEEEARLTFAGGLSGLTLERSRTVLFDIGGGSTEIIRGDGAARSIDVAVSLDVGSVRLTERHLRSDPPARAELDELDQAIAQILDQGPGPTGGEDYELVGVAGTVTTLAAIARGIDPYDGARVHGMRLGRDEVAEVASKLARLPLSERSALAGLSPKRADVIVAGSRLCLALIDRFRATSLVVSDRGVRWGLAEELARSGSPTR